LFSCFGTFFTLSTINIPLPLEDATGFTIHKFCYCPMLFP
jgi:hypothetical protein